MKKLERTRVADGVFFTSVPDETFKTVRLSVNFVLPLKREEIAANAVLPFVLCRGESLTGINRRLEALYGASLSPDADKIGQRHVLSVTVSTLRDRFAFGSEAVMPAAKLLCDLIFKPFVNNGAFDAAAVDSEKQNLSGLIAAQSNDKRRYALDRADEEMYPGEPYGLNRYGTAEAVGALTGADVYAAWRRALENAAVEIIYIGDGGSAMLELFRAAFSKITRAPAAIPAPERRGAAERVKEVTDRMDVTQAKLIMAWRTGVMLPDDTAPFEVMNCLYGLSPTSKLFANVREKLSLCYYCMSRFNRAMGFMLVDSGVQPANAEKAEAEIKLQLKAVADGDFSDGDLADAKRQLVNSYRELYGSPSSLQYYWTAQIINGTMASPEERCAAFEKVTREQAASAARGCSPELVYLLTCEKEGQ